MKEIIKYTKHYIIHFKDSESYPPQEVSNEWWKALMEQLNTQQFVMINWTYYNKFEIKVIKPFEVDDDLEMRKAELIEKQPLHIQKELERRMKNKKNSRDLSFKSLENAIETIKEQIV